MIHFSASGPALVSRRPRNGAVLPWFAREWGERAETAVFILHHVLPPDGRRRNRPLHPTVALIRRFEVKGEKILLSAHHVFTIACLLPCAPLVSAITLFVRCLSFSCSSSFPTMVKPTTKRSASGGATSKKEMAPGWSRSKFSQTDLRKLKKLGLLSKDTPVKMPGDEMIPCPDDGWRVLFFDFMLRGLSIPVHEFLRGLLFVYGVQLHQLTPNSILHISCFITLCECFLGIHPHWGLWKRIFLLRRNASKDAIQDVGGAIIAVRPEANYFDFKMAESVQGWRTRWFYAKDEKVGEQEYGLAPFDLTKPVTKLKSWDQSLSAAEVEETEPMVKKLYALQSTAGKELSGLQIITHFIRLRIQPLQSRPTAMWAFSGPKDASRVSEDLTTADLEKLARRLTKFTRKDEIPSSCRVKPFSAEHPLPAVSY